MDRCEWIEIKKEKFVCLEKEKELYLDSWDQGLSEYVEEGRNCVIEGRRLWGWRISLLHPPPLGMMWLWMNRGTRHLIREVEWVTLKWSRLQIYIGRSGLFEIVNELIWYLIVCSFQSQSASAAAAQGTRIYPFIILTCKLIEVDDWGLTCELINCIDL